MSVQDLVAELHAERRRLQEGLATIDEVLAGLARLYGDQPLAAPTPAPRPTPRKPRPAGTGAYICDKCGQRFNRPNGLSRHLNQTHGNRARAPKLHASTRRAEPETADRPSGSVDTALVLRCSQCGWEIGLADDADAQLVAHCRSDHNRSPHDRERQPRRARHFPAVLANGQSPTVIEAP